MLPVCPRRRVSAAAAAAFGFALMAAGTQPAFASCHRGGFVGPPDYVCWVNLHSRARYAGPLPQAKPIYVVGPRQVGFGGYRFGRGH